MGRIRGLGRIISLLLFCLLTVVLAWSPAVAFDLGEWVPGLKLSPFLSERVEYESNVFQAPSHSQGDVIFKTIPGILADYQFGSHSLSAGYRAEILNYATLTAQDNTHHIAAGQLRLEFPRTLINLKDDFTRTSDPPGTLPLGLIAGLLGMNVGGLPGTTLRFGFIVVVAVMVVIVLVEYWYFKHRGWFD